jgi:hypothetical protein
MSVPKSFVTLLSWTGLLVASSAWIINTQLGQILPYLDCQQQARFSALASFASTIVACLAGAISWRSANPAKTSDPPPTLAFVGSMNALAALIFAFAIFMQGSASLVLSGCER